MNALVTGGAGFIGSHLVERLVEDRTKVLVLDNFSSGSRENLKRVDKGKLRVLRKSIGSYDVVQSALKRADIVYHLAALSLGMSIVRPRFVHVVNDVGTFNLCMAAKTRKLKRLVYVSSSEAYGTAQYAPMDEKHPLDPTTPYGATKAAGEHYVRSFYNVWRLPAVVVRPFNTYGPRARTDRYSAVIPSFISRCLANQPPIVLGDGNQTRDFSYVTDTVEGIIRAGNSDDLIGNVVNIGNGVETSINQLSDAIIDLTGKKNVVHVVHAQARAGDVRRLLADISKSRVMLDYSPKVSLVEGLRLYLKWYLENFQKQKSRI